MTNEQTASTFACWVGRQTCPTTLCSVQNAYKNAGRGSTEKQKPTPGTVPSATPDTRATNAAQFRNVNTCPPPGKELPDEFPFDDLTVAGLYGPAASNGLLWLESGEDVVYEQGVI